MTFSVVIPTYNRATLITEAIESVLAQTCQDFEVLVVDDHSDDATIDVVERAAKKESRIRLLTNQRSKGAQGARNTGIFHAKGEWLAFLDSDDLWHPKRLEAHLQLLDESENDCLVGTWALPGWEGDSDTHLECRAMKKQSKRVSQDQVLYRNTLGGFSCLICKRSVAADVGGVDEQFPSMQDTDFYASLAGVGAMRQLHIPLVQMRKGDWAQISKQYDKKLMGALLIEDKYRHYMRSKLRLKLRASNRVLVHCILCGKYGAAIGRSPWFILSFLIDPLDAVRLCWQICKLSLRRGTAWTQYRLRRGVKSRQCKASDRAL